MASLESSSEDHLYEAAHCDRIAQGQLKSALRAEQEFKAYLSLTYLWSAVKWEERAVALRTVAAWEASR